MSTKKLVRLFETFKPSDYILELNLDPKGKKFGGTVTIRGQKTGRPSQRLTFHAKDLNVTSAILHKVHTKGSKTDGTKIKIDRINIQKSYDEVRLHTAENLYPGEYHVVLEFNGTITDPMNGLYPCYFTLDGKKKYLIATQFESHHAREVFPCIDEPEAKATFDLALITPSSKTETVIANTPVRSTMVEGDLTTTFFEITPIMSTYLLAFVHGEIGYKEAKTKSGTLVRAFATLDKVDQTDFALDVAVKCLDFYEDYFGIPFPLPKSDMIALPDFASGAMENWGLITYREQCMLVDPKNTSLPTKQYVAMVVAHELAHQWFGNLVTMRWWTDLWLNEGFASWIEYLAVDKLFPEWDMWTQFIVDEQQSAMKLDALDNTHPIEVPINHPDEIRSIFDAISYNKGASVIHMLHGYLGAEHFRDGLRHYLKQHAYKNTDTLDLWQALEDISKKPVKQFMHAWTSQPGFPIVSVATDGKKTNLTQERFYLDKPAQKSPLHWPVPVLGPADAPESFTSAQAVYTTAAPAKINQGQSGFYRTVYDPSSIAEFASIIVNFSPLDRLGLLSDSFEAAKSGYTPLNSALQLLAAYEAESNSAVWDIIAMNIGEIRRVMDDDAVRDAIKPFIVKLTARELNRLGWEEKATDSHFDKLLRPTIIGLNAGADEPLTTKEALSRFDLMKAPEDIPADLRGIIYTTAARNGDSKTFDKLLLLHNKTTNSEERVTLAAALTNFKQPALYEKALSLINTDIVRRQDAMYWLAYSFGNRFSKDAAWKWMVKNWGWLEKELGSDLSFSRTPIYAGRAFSNPEFLKEYNEFFKDKQTPGLVRAIKQGEEMLKWQIAWKQRDLAAIQAFLQS
ncbi:MAG: puromycin-sensitive aminopeptidase [Candidatus Saccharibacteria bacterium]|nr:puromycin-sensitive aminopeptidase [Candidatus Saccharibacteria bacterium]